ncbi:MAG: hypothetical protein ABMA14_18595 [Hyphomonadaceae bacterium]
MFHLTLTGRLTTARFSPDAYEVSASLLAPSHLLLHSPNDEPAYYEIIAPEIFRIGVNCGAELQLVDGKGVIDGRHLKRFDYVVLGHAEDLEGLAAPYDEENTECVIRHELLSSTEDIFAFWQAHSNSDQVSARDYEPRRFLDPRRQ